MTSPKAPPDIFDALLLRQRQLRAERRAAKDTSHTGDFFMRRAAQDIASRLQDINRSFHKALILGPPRFQRYILEALPHNKRPKAVTIRPLVPSNLELKPHTYDLVLTAPLLQVINDIVGVLIQARLALLPDGLFIGGLFGGNSLEALRRALYDTDDTILGGITPRIFPFADHLQAAAILGRSGLALPVVDTDRIDIKYRALHTLLRDLRDLGSTNIMKGRDKRSLTKRYWQKLEDNHETDDQGRYPSRFEILWMTGWAPHQSQQKPLKPGSAKTRLADALKTKEIKL